MLTVEGSASMDENSDLYLYLTISLNVAPSYFSLIIIESLTECLADMFLGCKTEKSKDSIDLKHDLSIKSYPLTCLYKMEPTSVLTIKSSCKIG